MSWWQALLLAVLQGATELFPVSSLGHAVLVPNLLGWGIDQSDRTFLPYITLLHLGTAVALLAVFRDDWIAIITGFARAVYRGRLGDDPHERLAVLVFIGTIPAGLLGAFFESELKKLFANPRTTAIFLLLNGAIMGAGELLRRRAEAQTHASAADREEAFQAESGLSFRGALIIGSSQALALLPGISRSGATITAGLMSGLRHQSAARFSFLLATPLILAAGLLEVPVLFEPGAPLPVYLTGAAVAGVTAYLSARFLLRYFRTGRLDPFAAYCAVLGIVGLVFAH